MKHEISYQIYDPQKPIKENLDSGKTPLLLMEHLRMMDYPISRGVSYEKTVDEFLLQLETNDSLRSLRNCESAVVLLNEEGALIRDKQGWELLFSPDKTEGTSMAEETDLYAILRRLLQEEKKDCLCRVTVPERSLKELVSGISPFSILDEYCKTQPGRYLAVAQRIVYEGMDEAYRIYVRRRGKEDCAIRLYCVDPSGKLAECLEKGVASVLFSATLLPIQYYKRLLGGKESDYEVYAKSSFNPEKLGLFVVSDVTSRYRMRGAEQYGKIAECIRSAVSQRHGNYMVFFPSYAFMEGVLEQYAALYPEDEETAFAVQSPQMTEEERQAFLERFDRISDEKSLIGFCVLGGIFSEGIDLREDRLIGSLVVGTGFPQVCVEREILKQYFDNKGDSGFDYAYRFPGMNKVLQAAGRVIRTSEDVGVVVLMDDRFATGAYRRLFPAEWSGLRQSDSLGIGRIMSAFWDSWL